MPDQNADSGLGDTVARLINSATGGLVRPCGGCKRRQEALNRAFPYKKKGVESTSQSEAGSKTDNIVPYNDSDTEQDNKRGILKQRQARLRQ
jgi:hypothetical protein